MKLERVFVFVVAFALLPRWVSCLCETSFTVVKVGREGVIVGDGDGKYENNRDDCTVLDVGEGGAIMLRIVEFDVEYGYDFVEVFSISNETRESVDHAVLIAAWTGDEIPAGETGSRGRYMLVRFTSDSIGTKEGYRATVRTVDEQTPRWMCNGEWYNNSDGCHCGCGAQDPDCDSKDASLNCYNSKGMQFPSSIGYKCNVSSHVCDDIVPATWTCVRDWYNNSDGCHCGCGAHDPDCDYEDASLKCYDFKGVQFNGSIGYQCNVSSHVCNDILPEAWTCVRDWYNNSDGCHCGCGAHDPDCDGKDTSLNCYDSEGVQFPSSIGFKCNVSSLVCDDLLPAAWACVRDWYNNSDGCHCGCGAHDPDCDEQGNLDVFCHNRLSTYLFRSVTFRCDRFVQESCDLPPLPVNCAALHRHPLVNSSYSCGVCLESYRSGDDQPGTSPCWYITVTSRMFRPVTGRRNPFNGVKPNIISNVVFEDLDEDGDLDAFIGGSDAGITYLRNEGDGAFEEVTENPFGDLDVGVGSGSNFAFMDVDGDGDLDAFIGHWTGSTGIVYYLHNNDSVFQLVTGSANPLDHVTMRGSNVALADIDNDGDLDAFILDRDRVAYYKNSGGVFTQVKGSGNPFNEVAVIGALNIRFQDLDGDGDLDAFTGQLDGTCGYYRNDGGTFAQVTGRLNPLDEVQVGGLGYSSVAFADLDGNGGVDAYVGAADGTIKMFENVEQRIPKFTEAKGRANPFHGVLNLANIAFADFDADGDLDAFGVGWEEDPIRYFRKDGNMFVEVTGPANPFDSFVGGWFITFADLDGDGDLDAFVGRRRAPSYFRNDDGIFVEVTGRINPFDGIHAESISFADLDEDGDLDAVVTIESRLRYFINDRGSFTQVNESANPFQGVHINHYGHVAFADLDGDGDLDAFIGHISPIVHLYLRNEDGVFTQITGSENPFDGAGTRLAFAFADLDSDGDLDAVVANEDRTLSYFRNTERECATSCTGGRGVCAQEISVDHAIFRIAAISQGFEDPNDAIGMCSCPPQFVAACEQCAPEWFGADCDQPCPPHSNTNLSPGQLVYPSGPTMEQCECRPGFVEIATRDSFLCLCPPGSGFDVDKDTCIECLPGAFKNSTSLDSCISCETVLGDFSTTNASGAVSVDDCVCRDGFQLRDGSCQTSICTTTGTVFTNKGCLAPAGTFKVVSDGLVVVRSCDEAILEGKVDCQENGSTLETLSLRTGHWRISSTSLDIRPCQSKSHCKPSYNDTGKTYCSPYHTGTMCAGCVDGFSMKDDQCKECTKYAIQDDNRMFAVWTTIGLILGLLPTLRLVQVAHLCCWCSCSKQARGTVLTPVARQGRGLPIQARNLIACVCALVQIISTIPSLFAALYRQMFDSMTVSDWSTIGITKVAVVVGFFQVLLLYLVTVNWIGNSVLLFLSNLDLMALFNTFQVGCYLPTDFYDHLLLVTLYPLGCICTVGITLLVIKRVTKREPDNRAAACRTDREPLQAEVPIAPADSRTNQGVLLYQAAQTEALIFTMVFLFYIYPSVSATIISVFLYEAFPHFEGAEDADTSFALGADYTVDFESARSSSFRIYAILMCLVYPVGVVLLFLWITVRTQNNSSNVLVKASNFLTSDFKDRFYWWETYELVRKLAQTSLFLIVHQTWEAGSKTVFAAVTLVAVSLLLQWKPYKHHTDQLLAVLSQFLLMGMNYSTAIIQENETVKQTWVIIVVSVVELGAFVGLLCWEIKTRAREDKVLQEARAAASAARATATVAEAWARSVANALAIWNDTQAQLNAAQKAVEDEVEARSSADRAVEEALAYSTESQSRPGEAVWTRANMKRQTIAAEKKEHAIAAKQQAKTAVEAAQVALAKAKQAKAEQASTTAAEVDRLLRQAQLDLDKALEVICAGQVGTINAPSLAL